MLGEHWSTEDVGKIPIPGAVQKISDKIMELGGHDLYEGLKKGVAQNVRTFRNNGRGPSNHRTAHDEDSAGQQPTGNDHGSEGLLDGRSDDSVGEEGQVSA
jgi:hypothetical protein